MIYQMHDDHGRHMATTPQEAKENEKLGWKTVTKDKFYEEITKRLNGGKATDAVDDESRADLVEQYVSKFGEQPHHRKSNATIQAELDQ